MALKNGSSLLGVVMCGWSAGCTVQSGSEPLGSSEQELRCDDAGTRFYVPPPNPGAREQINALRAAHKKKDAALIKDLVETPQAVWFTGGTPRSIQRDVMKVVERARHEHAVPVLVAYNIPFRDCAQFSAGGATTMAEYMDWIDGFAAGIGERQAVVILEPDGLGIIPFYNPFADRDTWLADPNVLEWCQPPEADPATAAAERFEMLNYAVGALKANPNTTVYLDGTHSGWLGAGDATDRLLQGGVKNADGFFLNTSNYVVDAHLEKYGTWISKCIWFADPTSGSWGAGHAEWCASQYSPADPADFSSWTLSDQWYTDNVEAQTWVPYPGDAGLKHFVTDTSRNGVGPWQATPEQQALGDVQDWCNPPGRGVGVRPSTETSSPLIDAYLWIKVPGESDGQCNRWEPAGSPDPVRGMMDPVAGEWFPEMALELARNAKPRL